MKVAQSVRTGALRKGRVAVGVVCTGACRVSASLQVGSTTAKRLGLGKSRAIATASGSRSGAGTVTLRLKPTRKARPRLARLGSYRATLRVTVTPSGGGEPTRTTAKVRVRR